MTTIAARHERHMMRQRGAGARSIPTNFGFIFQAGPIQVTDTTAVESPLPAHSPPIAVAATQTHHIPESSLSSQPSAPKRKRLVRKEEDDQVWFKKRTKKTTPQEQNDHAILTATTNTGLDLTQEEPPTDKKQAKRKVVRKRLLVPTSRKKASLKPQPDQPISIPEPVVEDLPPPNKKRTKTLAISKQTSAHQITLDPSLLAHGEEDKLNNHSIHTLSVTESAPFKTKSSQDPQEARVAEMVPKKAVSRRKVVRKHIKEIVETAQPSLEESTQTTTTILEEDVIDQKPKAKTTRQRKVAKRHPEKLTEQQIDETHVDAQPDPPHETNPSPKKKKLVRRVRVPRTTTKRAASEQGDSVNTVNEDDTNPSVSSNDVDSALLKTVARAPIAKKSSKTPKRIFFNDDSDIDLDQMLSGIAAIAGTKGDAKTSTSKSSRVARKKIAV